MVVILSNLSWKGSSCWIGGGNKMKKTTFGVEFTLNYLKILLSCHKKLVVLNVGSTSTSVLTTTVFLFFLLAAQTFLLVKKWFSCKISFTSFISPLWEPPVRDSIVYWITDCVYLTWYDVDQFPMVKYMDSGNDFCWIGSWFSELVWPMVLFTWTTSAPY